MYIPVQSFSLIVDSLSILLLAAGVWCRGDGVRNKAKALDQVGIVIY